MDITSVRNAFMDRLKQIKSLDYASNVVFWDMATGSGKRGIETRSSALGVLSAQSQSMMVSESFAKELEFLEQHASELPELDQLILSEARFRYDRISKIPADEYRQYSELTSKASVVWEEAKEAKDFDMFAPYLKEVVAFKRKFSDYFGYEDHPYNAHLEDFERGVTVAVLDEFFENLKETIVPLVQKIKNVDQPEDDFLYLNYQVDGQKSLSENLLKTIGFDLEAGILKESAHPFTMGLAVDDVRLTTHYYENNFTSAIFSTIHEGGHGIYEQNFSKDIAGTLLADGASAGIHESQSRMFENNIGRSFMFWKYYYPLVQTQFKKQLDRVPLEMFIKAINQAKPSFIRVEADELTYSLHIMVRYELEKSLIDGSLEVENLRNAWNDKMEKYLGIVPHNDAQGVLQDVHWSEGLFGYFPTYALGTAYAAQIFHSMSQEIELDKHLEKGNFDPIKAWLVEHVHQYGMTKTPAEIIQIATGKSFDPSYYTNYLKQKFEALYHL